MRNLETEEGSSGQGQSYLLPERHPEHDLFLCDVQDAALKEIMSVMEHPFYSLSKKPETSIRQYEHNGNWLRVIPSVKGLATIYDKDILIYCISKVMAKVRRSEKPSKAVYINSYELLQFTNRGTSGRDYQALIEALERIQGTRITTNIRTGDEEQTHTFGLVDSSMVKRKFGLDGRLTGCEVVLSDWVFNAISANEVLTLHRDYFRLRKPLERRVYELARKHCGSQPQWEIGVGLLLKKSGSRSPLKRFREMLRHIARHNHLPDYEVTLDSERDIVIFCNRGTMHEKREKAANRERNWIALKPQTYEQAREIAPGWDVYAIEQEWRDWMVENPRDPNRAFLGFCRKWAEKRGRPPRG